MPDRIQRVPNGLLNLLSLQGGRTPELVADQVVGELELLQFYGLTQLTTQSSSANPAEGTSVALTLSSTAWTILFGASAEFTATGTLTALAGEVRLTRSGMAQALAA